nr:hydrocephalus-inducing protein-like isoform X2 [Paramormyrops kingsleyae]
MLSGMDKPAPAVLSQGLMSKVRASGHHKLLEEQHQQIRMTPSAFAHEMSLSTEQRLVNTHAMHPPRILEVLDMSETTHQKFSSVDIDQALFQPFPSEIVFQNYSPSESYEVPLVLRNTDKIPRLVKVVEEESLYFKVISPADMCSKVAPGLASTFTVLFTPQENKDYIHRVICVTERERFEVPIRAVGPRAILDFPDHLHFPVSPVKCLSQRTLLVRNVGRCEARFQLSTRSPFSVDPPLGTLGVGQNMQVTVDFLPNRAGDCTEDLRLHYHSGEDLYINIYGAAADVNVRLDRNSVLMKRTYISMASQRCVTLANRSDVIVHYQWKCFGTEEEEEQLKLRPCSDLLRQEEKKMEHFLTECTDDPAFHDHLSRLSSTFFKQQRQLREERLVFSGDHIIISPTEGDIWPNSTAEFTVTFKPQEVKIYQQTVYCDVTGRESRLPLRIRGEGIGPSLEFSFDLLDVGNIFIHSKHSYEVLLSNKGYIDAPFHLVPPSSAQGRCFSFSPSEDTVPPGSCHAMVVSFSSGILGMFSEEILFAVEGNPQPISLTFRGRVMGPTFQFSVPELNFGDVSFGFPCTLTFQLNNTSLIPMTFNLRILGDGSGPPSISSMDQVSDPNRTDWAGHSDPTVQPAEFRLGPSSGTIQAQGLVDVQATLCPNRVQMYNLALVVDVQGVGEEVMSLHIHARCVVPKVRLVKPTLELEGCFLNHPFTMSVKLTNEADLPACYGLLPQEHEEGPSFLYSCPHPRGIIQPRGEAEIPLLLQAKTVGRLVVAAHIAVFGSEEPPLELIISGVGEGPVLHISPTELDFGSIPVLTDVPRTVRLLNQSPIPAPFLAHMVRRRSQWRVEPSEGAVAPEGELQLMLVACLDDTVPFHDKLHLAIEHSQARSVAVSAKGEGTTIVTDRPFAPSLHLGAHFR